MTKLPLMLFAAGLGTRMGALTANRPKPLVEVAGQSLLQHALQLTNRADIGPIVMNVHYKPDELIAFANQNGIAISDETDELLDTGGGLKKARPLLGTETVATLNTDAIWKGLNPFEALLQRWDASEMDALLLLVPRRRAFAHPGKGDFFISDDGKLSRGAGSIYTGLQLVKTDGLRAMPDGPFSMNIYWDEIARRGRLFGLEYSGEWCDVGRPESIEIAENLLALDV